MITLSPRGMQLLAALRANLQLLEEHKKQAPHEVADIYRALAAHIRSADPMALGGGL